MKWVLIWIMLNGQVIEVTNPISKEDCLRELTTFTEFLDRHKRKQKGERLHCIAVADKASTYEYYPCEPDHFRYHKNGDIYFCPNTNSPY